MSGFRGNRGGYGMRVSPRGRDEYRGRGGFNRGRGGFSDRGRFDDYDNRYENRRYDDFDRDRYERRMDYDDDYRGGRSYYEDDHRKDFRGRGRPSFPIRGRGAPRGFSGNTGGRDGGPVSAEMQELMTKTLFLQSKKFYIDVKENKKGKFVRISEVAVTGQKMKIVIDLCDVPEFHEKLTQLCEVLTALGPEKTHRGYEKEEKLSSESIYRDSKRYFLDLKQNHRGRFLKISMTPANNERSQVVIPAEGLVEVRDVLTDVLNEFPADAQRHMIAEDNLIDMGEGKSIAFERNKSVRGEYVKINETCGTFSTSLLVGADNIEDFVRLVEEAMNTADEVLAQQDQEAEDNGKQESKQEQEEEEYEVMDS